MIEHDVPQGDREWEDLRLGIPTASAFHKIVTPSQLKPSKQADQYADELLAEFFTGEPVVDLGGPWFDRGHEQEELARTWYEFDTGREVRQIGFVTNDAGTVGCSPDGLVDPDGGIEIKCFGAAKHMGIVRRKEIPPPVYLQIAGNLWICEREWWDFVAFNTKIEPVVIRVERDDAYIEALSRAVLEFSDSLEEEKQRRCA